MHVRHHFRRFISFMKEKKESPHFKWGAPFMVILFAAYLGLTEGQKLHFEKKDKSRNMITEEEIKEYKKKMKPMTQIYKEYRKSADLDSWENIRGPRPWEDSKTMQDEQRKNLGMKTSESE